MLISDFFILSLLFTKQLTVVLCAVNKLKRRKTLENHHISCFEININNIILHVSVIFPVTMLEDRLESNRLSLELFFVRYLLILSKSFFFSEVLSDEGHKHTSIRC